MRRRWWDNWSYKSWKAPVKSSPPTNRHPVLFTGRMPFLSPNQQCQSTEGKISLSMDHWTCLPQAHLGVFQLCLWPLIAPGYIGEGCHASHQLSAASTPTAGAIRLLQVKYVSQWPTNSVKSMKVKITNIQHFSTPKQQCGRMFSMKMRRNLAFSALTQLVG